MPTIYTTKKLPKRAKLDTYITPKELALASLKNLTQHPWPPQVLDPGAGTGVWGWAVRQRYPKAKITGVEIRKVKAPHPYNTWVNQDFMTWYGKSKTIPRFDLIVGNPPYKQAEDFIRHSFELLDSAGTILFLLPSHFLHSEKRGLNLFSDLTPYRIMTLMQRPNFEGQGTANPNTYVLVEWKGKANYEGITYHDWLNWKPVDKSPGLE